MSVAGGPPAEHPPEVHRSTDPRALLSRCTGLLTDAPIWTNIAATVAATEIARGERRSTYLWLERSGEVSAVALWVPSQPVCLSDCSAADAAAFAHQLHRSGHDVVGVTGPVATAQAFARQWNDLTGAVVRPGMRQGVHVCEQVVPPSGVLGGARRAGVDDLDLVTGWTTDFSVEIGSSPARTEAVLWSVADDRVWLWQEPPGPGNEPRPVCLAVVRTAPSGMARIGPVYTPPRHRRQGYASALTAHVTQQVLTAGDRVMLLTDLDNPTSNSIYAAVGYRRVGEAVVLGFDPPTATVG